MRKDQLLGCLALAIAVGGFACGEQSDNNDTTDTTGVSEQQQVSALKHDGGIALPPFLKSDGGFPKLPPAHKPYICVPTIEEWAKAHDASLPKIPDSGLKLPHRGDASLPNLCPDGGFPVFPGREGEGPGDHGFGDGPGHEPGPGHEWGDGPGHEPNDGPGPREPGDHPGNR